ncbi:MAG: sigma-70 family RNA polymerase sigma factor [Flavobacteriales bacterium]|nr:sigma-70 family RNA polymerase sigma factor [Flavobacteriales bacterium]
MEDNKIIELLKVGKHDKVFLNLYKNYPQVEKLILSKGGSKEDAKDVFQEALIIFYEKVRNTDFKLTAAIGTYLYSVSRFLWKDEFIKRKGQQTVDLSFEFTSEEEMELQKAIEREAKFKQIESVLTQLGDKCLRLLKLFYYEGLSMKIIASKVGLKSEKIAKNQKYKCLERAKLKVSEI